MFYVNVSSSLGSVRLEDTDNSYCVGRVCVGVFEEKFAWVVFVFFIVGTVLLFPYFFFLLSFLDISILLPLHYWNSNVQFL